jgi:putative protein-disulfide isomerase
MKLYFILDPMCSWCWGFRSAFERLRPALPEQVQIQYVMGGLAQDSDEPMPKKTRDYVQSQWKLVSNDTGAEFNWDFWQRCEPRRSTYPACRAVIATGLQNEDARAKMIYAIQRAYYLDAKNPSDLDTLIECATEIGLDTQKFTEDMQSAQTDQLLKDELDLRRQLGVTGFPSLRLEVNGLMHDIDIDYRNPASMLQQINKLAITDE